MVKISNNDPRPAMHRPSSRRSSSRLIVEPRQVRTADVETDGEILSKRT
jgi:hypothetical protein